MIKNREVSVQYPSVKNYFQNIFLMQPGKNIHFRF
jgi:hypothetical protein